MTRDEYFALVAECDAALMEPWGPEALVAVPWLHVIREHPVFLTKYDAVFEWHGLVNDLRDAAKQRVSAFLYQRRAAQQPQDRREPSTDARVDVLFVSHLLNAAQAEAPDDFYFGSVPRDLEAAGLSTHVALIDHTRGYRPGQAAPLARREVLPQVLGSKAEAAITRQLSDVARYLGRARRGKTGLPARVRQVASWQACGPEAAGALRIAHHVEALVRRLKPRVVITTHEGHAWERLLFRAARRAHPGVRVVGYHATALFALQHALTRSLAPECNPDVILTAGRVTADALRAKPGLSGIPIRVLGSNRRFELSTFDRTVLHPGIVVVPEGYVSECRILFQTAVLAARMDPRYRWFLRLHPQMSFDEVRPELEAGGALPPNVVLSTRALADDFRESSWALYRGSSAAIQAMGAGLRPIYVEANEPLTIDPMYQYGDWRARVRNGADVLAICRADELATPEFLQSQRQAAAQFAADYFEPLSATALAQIVEEAAR